jgi:hypothetical protein
MKEKVENIALSIKNHRESEMRFSMKNAAIGRNLVNYDGQEQVFWLTNKENISGYNVYDFNGNFVDRYLGDPTTLTTDGRAIYKNTIVGGVLISNHKGTHEVNVPAGKKLIRIYNRASYMPNENLEELARDIIIKIAGDKKTHSFQSLNIILLLQEEIINEKNNLNYANKEEETLLIQRINQKEAEMKEYLDKAQGFIRRNANLRYQPILDPTQENIKRSDIFEGTLIINGGPGTGKTTSLIQRIKFLISDSIQEYINLSERQKSFLFDQKTSWVFYSPNELLALSLRNSMRMEELLADNERVKVWKSHKNDLIKVYKLIDTATKKPFLIYNKADSPLFKIKHASIFNIITSLNEYFLQLQNTKLEKVTQFDVSSFSWKITGKSIQNFLKSKGTIRNFDELNRLYINLNETYKKESLDIVNSFTDLNTTVAGRVLAIILKDSERQKTLLDLLTQWKTTNLDADEDEDDDDSLLENEDFDESQEIISSDFETELFSKIKSLCRKLALRKYDKNTRITKRDKQLIEIMPEIENHTEYETIGQIAFFKKHFERITKGINSNVLREIPMTYKKFRREQLASKNTDWDINTLSELVKKDKNSRIHPDEQSLLLLFVNNICTSLFKGFPKLYEELNHNYLTAFKANCKPVIGVDEATDFSLIDLLAINSFRHPELSSMTLSGDIMQRMTENGINSWEDFSKLVPGTAIKNLEVSYRQSPTLLTLAKLIYEKTTAIKSSYTSFMDKDEAEPKPLLIVSEDEEYKLNWIADRIVEIYRAYGDSIPSIAIFLPNENQLESFAYLLGSIDTLADVGILVKACRNGEVLGDKNTVRVFSIDKIKGLEFEAVFFHNMDTLQGSIKTNEQLLKYMYVGLSRATFYLALTLNQELGPDLDFITDHFDRSGLTWKN